MTALAICVQPFFMVKLIPSTAGLIPSTPSFSKTRKVLHIIRPIPKIATDIGFVRHFKNIVKALAPAASSFLFAKPSIKNCTILPAAIATIITMRTAANRQMVLPFTISKFMMSLNEMPVHKILAVIESVILNLRILFLIFP